MRGVLLSEDTSRGTLRSTSGSVKRHRIGKRELVRLAVDLLRCFGGEPITPQLLEQTLARQAERARRARLVAARLVERLAQTPLLERAGLGVEPTRRNRLHQRPCA